MKKIFLLLLIALSINSFGQNKALKTITIPFELLGGGHILITAKVNNIEGKFIFDTGAGLNLLTKKFADKVTNLKKTDGFYTGHRATGEAIDCDLWNSETLEIGSFNSKKQKFTTIDMEFPVDGLISLLPFKETPFTIDYKNKVLILETEKSLKELTKIGTILPIQISEDAEKTLGISTYIKVNDKLTLQMNLDSGAGFNVFRFSSRYMEKLGIDSAKVEKKYRASDFKPTEGNNYYFTNLNKISPALSDKIKADDFKATFIEGLIYEAIGSINWLGDKITIDIQKKVIIINN
jgi:hypothetical protein